MHNRYYSGKKTMLLFEESAQQQQKCYHGNWFDTFEDKKCTYIQQSCPAI
jgi:hypothetical protein